MTDSTRTLLSIARIRQACARAESRVAAQSLAGRLQALGFNPEVECLAVQIGREGDDDGDPSGWAWRIHRDTAASLTTQNIDDWDEIVSDDVRGLIVLGGANPLVVREITVLDDRWNADIVVSEITLEPDLPDVDQALTCDIHETLTVQGSSIIGAPARLSSAAMGYFDDDEGWHDFDGVEVSFMLPRDLAKQGIRIGHRGRLTFTVTPAEPSTNA